MVKTVILVLFALVAIVLCKPTHYYPHSYDYPVATSYSHRIDYPSKHLLGSSYYGVNNGYGNYDDYAAVPISTGYAYGSGYGYGSGLGTGYDGSDLSSYGSYGW